MEQKVFNALDLAIRSGYEIPSGKEPVTVLISLDLMDCAGFKYCSVEELSPFVEKWLAIRELSLCKGWDLG